jgi:hypothetical protein
MFYTHQTLTTSRFLSKTASVDTSQRIISTFWSPKLFDQSELVYHRLLVSYWLNVLLFLVSYADRRNFKCNRKTASF